MTAHLDRLLFAQGGECFFCRKPLPQEEASVEHLVASANGGTNEDGNCVACCKALNHLLGSKTIKEKLQIVLNQRGEFRCPGGFGNTPKPVTSPNASTSAREPPVSPSSSIASAIDLAVADLKKRGASRPRKFTTLASTIKSLLKQHKKPHSDSEVSRVISELQDRGKVTITDLKVTYKLG